MSVQINPVIKNARLQVILAAIDVGSDLVICAGTQPAAGAPIVTELGRIPFLNPAGSVTDQVLTLNLTAQVPATAGGDPTWARVENGAGGYVMDLTVGAEVIIDPVPVYEGGFLNVQSAAISE